MGTIFFGQVVHDWEFYQQLFPFDKQQEHLAELQELCLVNVPAIDHSRLHEFYATSYSRPSCLLKLSR